MNLSIPPSKDEQNLEWTFRYRWCDCTGHVLHFLVSMIIGVPALMLTTIIPSSFNIIILFGIVLLIVLAVWYGRPSRTLHINQQTITLTNASGFGVKERRMNITGAKVRAVYFDFLERLFTFDMYRGSTAHHIEVSRNGETFLFPCVDEKEQKQIVEQIKQQIDSGGGIA